MNEAFLLLCIGRACVHVLPSIKTQLFTYSFVTSHLTHFHKERRRAFIHMLLGNDCGHLTEGDSEGMSIVGNLTVLSQTHIPMYTLLEHDGRFSVSRGM